MNLYELLMENKQKQKQNTKKLIITISSLFKLSAVLAWEIKIILRIFNSEANLWRKP